MRQVTFLFFLVACFLVCNAVENHEYKILKSAYELEPVGAYNFFYETENAIQQNEEGVLKNIKNEEGKDEQIIAVRGSYSYVDPLGVTITVNYYADETGFHPEGAHIPVPSGPAFVGVGQTTTLRPVARRN